MATSMNELHFIWRSLVFMGMLCLSGELYSQDYQMLHFTVENGLPSNKIYNIYKDSKGYLWIASDKGVARYNGVEFKKFTTSDGLPDNEIFLSKEDYNHRIWFGTYNGELCYFKNDTIHTAANTPFLKMARKAAQIQSIDVENDSSVTIILYLLQTIVKIKNERLSIVNVPPGSNLAHSTTSVHQLSHGLFSVLYENGLGVIDSNGRVVVDTPTNLGFMRDVSFPNKKYSYSSSNVIFNTDMQVVRRMNQSFSMFHQLLSYYDDGKNYYYGTTEGLIINDSIILFPNQSISSINRDLIGNYWISTLDDGIYVLRKDYFNTKHTEHVYGGFIKYYSNIKNQVFFGNSFNNVYHVNNRNIETVFNYKRYRNLDTVRKISEPGIFIDTNYSMYSFFDEDFFYIKNLLSKKTETEKFNMYDNLGYKKIIKINNHLYIKNRLGIHLFDVGPKFKNRAYEKGTELVMQRTYGMAKDPNGQLWYTTINGMYKIENNTNVHKIAYDSVVFKLFEFCGNYLIGVTHDNKLAICSHWDSPKPRIKYFNEPNCVLDNIYPVDACHTLISTDKYWRIVTHCPTSIDKEACNVRTIEDPFVPIQVEAFIADSTFGYFFKKGAVISLDLQSLYLVIQPPTLAFSSVSTRNNHFPVKGSVALPYSESSNISVSFSTIAFGSQSLTYLYSASRENEPDLWIPMNQNDVINLTNPWFGKYTIKLKAKSVSSDFSVPIQFQLIISPPFWATWWFVVLSASGCIVAIWYMVRFRIRYVITKRNKKHSEEIKFMKSEYKALNALMNPHFIFNTLNNVQSLVNDNNKRAANEYLRIFADLIRQNMYNVSRELIPLEKEMELIKNYLLLEKLRFEDKLEYELTTDQGVDLTGIMIPPLLIQPLVENSLKHGIWPLTDRSGFLKVSISEKDDVLHISIRDNGVGLGEAGKNKSTSHEPYGLENIKKRIDQLGMIQNKHIRFDIKEEIDSENNQRWTIVTISLPIDD